MLDYLITHESSPALKLSDHISHWKKDCWFCCLDARYQWMSEPNCQVYVLVIVLSFLSDVHGSFSENIGYWTLHWLVVFIFFFFKSAFIGCTAFWSDTTFDNFKTNNHTYYNLFFVFCTDFGHCVVTWLHIVRAKSTSYDRKITTNADRLLGH